MLMSPVRLAWQVQVVRRGFLAVSARFAGPFAPKKRNHACVTTKVRPRQLLFLKGIKLNAIADRPAYFASLRARRGQPIVILAELGPDEAFALWKQHVLGDRPR